MAILTLYPGQDLTKFQVCIVTKKYVSESLCSLKKQIQEYISDSKKENTKMVWSPIIYKVITIFLRKISKF